MCERSFLIYTIFIQLSKCCSELARIDIRISRNRQLLIQPPTTCTSGNPRPGPSAAIMMNWFCTQSDSVHICVVSVGDAALSTDPWAQPKRHTKRTHICTYLIMRNMYTRAGGALRRKKCETRAHAARGSRDLCTVCARLIIAHIRGRACVCVWLRFINVRRSHSYARSHK